MWVYNITTGEMKRNNTTFRGYSGAGHELSEGRNNPKMVSVVKEGPLPPGVYDIGTPHISPHTGPYTMNLGPRSGNEMFGRSAFRIHGNNAEDDASEGCIILPPGARRGIWESGDHELQVISGEEQ